MKKIDIRYLNAALKINDRPHKESDDTCLLHQLENDEQKAMDILAKKLGVVI